MWVSPQQLPARAMPWRAAQPVDRAGIVSSHLERRRPHDRRQRDEFPYLDLRASKQERRRQHRRSLYEPGRRWNPEPPRGVDFYA